MDARSINAAHASMSRKPLLERLREHNSFTEIEAANEIDRLQNMLVDAKNERDIWRERALAPNSADCKSLNMPACKLYENVEVIASVGLTNYPLTRLSREDFGEIDAKNPDLVGIPQYWTPTELGFSVWPTPRPDIDVQMFSKALTIKDGLLK